MLKLWNGFLRSSLAVHSSNITKGRIGHTSPCARCWQVLGRLWNSFTIENNRIRRYTREEKNMKRLYWHFICVRNGYINSKWFFPCQEWNKWTQTNKTMYHCDLTTQQQSHLIFDSFGRTKSHKHILCVNAYVSRREHRDFNRLITFSSNCAAAHRSDNLNIMYARVCPVGGTRSNGRKILSGKTTAIWCIHTKFARNNYILQLRQNQAISI